MRRLHALPLLLALPPLLVLALPFTGCVPGPATEPAAAERPMTVHGLRIARIEPDDRVVLADGPVILGDARLAAALAAGGAAILDIAILERMPPVYVVTYADGETRRYPSRME